MSTVMFFLVFSVICALLVVYPYLIYPLILKKLPSINIEKSEGDFFRTTLLFCAFNEESVIEEKLQNIEEIKKLYPNIEVLAFDDGSTDNTYKLLSKRPDLLTVYREGGRNGKAFGMKLLAGKAKGEILVFTDANVLLEPNSLQNLFAYYSDPTIGGVCGSLKYIGEEESSTASVGSAYWQLEEYLKKEESRTGNVMGADGSVFSIRSDLYPDFPDSVLDDLTVSMAVVFNNKRLVKAEDVIAQERLVVRRGEEFSRKVRIATRAYHTHMHLAPHLKKMSLSDKFKYVSRKFLRWFGGLFLILGSISFFLMLYFLHPIASVSITLLSVFLIIIGMKSTQGKLSSIVEILFALVATLIGVFRAMRGKTQTTWNPAKSR